MMYNNSKMRIIILAVLLTITLSQKIECFKDYIFDKDDAKACEIYRQMLYNGLSQSKGNQLINKILMEANYKKNPYFWQAYIPINIHELSIMVIIIFQIIGRIFLYLFKQMLGKKSHNSSIFQILFLQLEISLSLEIWQYLNEEEKIQFAGKFILSIKIIISLICLATETFRKVNNCNWIKKIGVIAYYILMVYSLFGFYQLYREITEKLYVLFPLYLLCICTCKKIKIQNYFMFGIIHYLDIHIWPILAYKANDQYIAPLPSWLIHVSLITNQLLVITKTQPKKYIYKIKNYLQRRAQVKKNEKTLRYYLESMQKSNEDAECSICLQMMKLEEKTYNLEFIEHVRDWSIIKTPCNHFYHKICLSKWMKESTKCPIDSSTLQLKNQ